MVDKQQEAEFSATSRFNEAQLQVIRLSKFWEQSHQAFLNANPDRMYWILSRIYVELYPDLIRQKGKNSYLKEYKKLRHEYYEGFKEKNRGKKFFACNKIELFLKDLQCQVGKGSSYQEDSSRMF